MESGKIILRGVFAFDRQITHVLSELDNVVTNKTWQFVRRVGGGDESVIAERMRLLPDGRIDGYSHPNEARWGLEGDTLVFYAQDGRPSTRFPSIGTDHGRMSHRGIFLFDPGITHELRELDLQVRNKIWQFCRWVGLPLREEVIASLRLLDSGVIDGSTHPNETRWGWEGETLVFYAVDGTPSTRFDQVRAFDQGRKERGRMLRSGSFLFDPGIRHILREWNIDANWTWGKTYVSWLPAAV
jgi:hypothetical protein